MGIQNDLHAEVTKIFKATWTQREGQSVPESEDLGLGNDAVRLTATVLYADLSESTSLVDAHEAYFAAEIYKAYLHCAAKLLHLENGKITAYDGDRIMGVFIGSSKNTSAVRAALKINWARLNIINPALQSQYPSTKYRVHHTIGVDTSPLWVARTGIRGANDLVWVGRAANYAAKLCDLGPEYPTWITEDVHTMLADEAKFTSGQAMWEARLWTVMNNKRIYRSNWHWKVA